MRIFDIMSTRDRFIEKLDRAIDEGELTEREASEELMRFDNESEI